PIPVSVIYQDQWLLSMNAYFSEGPAFPACLLQEPGGGYLYTRLIFKSRNSWVDFFKIQIGGFIDSGIFEKAAGIAYDFGIGKFTLADMYHSLADGLQARTSDSHFF